MPLYVDERELIEDVKTRLNRIIQRGTGRGLFRLGLSIESAMIGIREEEGFPESLHALLLETIRNPEFQKLRGTSHFLHLYETFWRSMSHEQRIDIYSAFCDTFGAFSDKWTPFLITEHIGLRYEPSEGLRFFEAVSQDPNPKARMFVPHGISHVLEAAQDDDTRCRAMELLQKMRRDEDPRVSYEADCYAGVRPKRNWLSWWPFRRNRKPE